MNKNDFMYKKFRVNEYFSISRNDYESFPCSMIAFNWTDEEMTNLANKIKNNLPPYDEDFEDEAEGDFWLVMESTACDMGMKYYEDLSDEEYENILKEKTALLEQ